MRVHATVRRDLCALTCLVQLFARNGEHVDAFVAVLGDQVRRRDDDLCRGVIGCVCC
jgi:hypothetical protein